jgi:serine/tyrosine/threonine adenylyltransferase
MAAPTLLHNFLDALPGDAEASNHTREVTGALWSRVQPTPVKAPQLLSYAKPLAQELGLSDALMQAPETAAVLGGNALWPGMQPYAANYGGHQFGHWAGQLGDGRAIVLGELTRPDGATVELQLKGAGPTPYSRRADGRAVLRSSIREFLCSEAMHALGVPTTRALSLVQTGDQVLRDMFYNGNAKHEPGAIVCRVAPSFLRFGSYQLPYARKDHALLKTLADFTLRNWFPQFADQGKDGYAAWLSEVAERTARLVAHWQAVGFVHGVLNTDNMSILGLTIDYGPYGWTDNFDLGWTPNTTDAQQHRYAFGNQPTIGLWNCMRLGEALLPLLDDDESCLEAAASRYQQAYGQAASKRFCDKLGITFQPEHDDAVLLQDCFDWLGKEETDMTLFFRSLANVVVEPQAPSTMPFACQEAFYGNPSQDHVQAGLLWLQRWHHRTRKEGVPATAQAEQLNRCNPKFVLRNWLSQTAIDAAEQGDLTQLERLSQVMQRPFDEQPEHEDLAKKRPEWARHKPGCSALSCSS